MTQNTNYIPTQDQISAVVGGAVHPSAHPDSELVEKYVEEDEALAPLGTTDLAPAPPAHFMLEDSPGSYNFPPYLATAEQALEFWGEVPLPDDEIIRFIKVYETVREAVKDQIHRDETDRRHKQWLEANPKKRLESESTYVERRNAAWRELNESEEVSQETVNRLPLPFLEVYDIRHLMIAVKLYYWGPKDEWSPEEAGRTRSIKLQLTHGIYTVDQIVQMYGYKRYTKLIGFAESIRYISSTDLLEDVLVREFRELKSEINDVETSADNAVQQLQETNNLLAAMLPDE